LAKEPLTIIRWRTDNPGLARETFVEAAEFVCLAMIKRHALGILTEADETETEVGFIALLVEVQPNEWAADPTDKPGTHAGIQKSRPYQLAGQRYGRTTNRNRERAGRSPKDVRTKLKLPSRASRRWRDQAYWG
jgi:hypothetical protein